MAGEGPSIIKMRREQIFPIPIGQSDVGFVRPPDAVQSTHSTLRLKETAMFEEKVREGFDVYVHDAAKSFGAVRDVGQGRIVVYVENAGDFTIPLSAVKEVHDEKVVLDCGKLDIDLRRAIGHAHESEHTPYG